MPHFQLPIPGHIPHPTAPPEYVPAAGTNRPYLAFDGTTTIESCVWVFRIPDDYTTDTIKAHIQWSASGGTAPNASVDQVQWTIYFMAYTPNTDTGQADVDDYGTENVFTDEADNTNAQAMMSVTSSVLSNDDGLVAGDYCAVRLLRDYSDAADTLAEDAWLWSISLEFDAA